MTYENYIKINEILQECVEEEFVTLEDAEIVNEVAYQLYTEKKTREEYARSKFLKKHNYDPKTNTIDLNGERVYLHEDKKKRGKLTNYYGSKTPDPVTGAMMITKNNSPLVGYKNDKNTLHIDKTLWKAKNSKEREAIINHEDVHSKKHFKNPSKEVVDSFTDTLLNDPNKKELFKNGLLNKDSARIATCGKLGVDPYKERPSSTPSRLKKYKELYPKYMPKTGNGHAGLHELEADDGAIKKSGSSTYKRALIRTTKNVKKANKKLINNMERTVPGFKEAQAELQRSNDNEQRLRNKFAKDYGKNRL